MKKLMVFLVFPALFFSCSNVIDPVESEKEVSIESPVESCISLGVLVAIVDEGYNDLLNPQLPKYLGDEYTNGIEVLYLVDGKKLSRLDYYHAVYDEIMGEIGFILNDFENIKTISPPYRYVPGYGNIQYGTLGKYFINCTNFWRDDKSISYIKYPNGKEDEIKVEIYKSGSLTTRGKVWVNDELAYDLMSRYYNPKYFPFMKPVLYNGEYMGFDMPETTEFLLWFVK